MLSSAQNDNEDRIDPEDTIRINNMKSQRSRLFAFSTSYLAPISSGNNYFGQGMKGNGGFGFKAQVYVYKNIFVAFNIQQAYFEVSDPELTGNYDKTRLGSQYIALGYEFIPFKDVRLGVGFSFLGNADYNNIAINNGNTSKQRDDGNVRSLEAYFDYEINHFFAVCLNYGYRSDRMNIQTAPEIQEFFKKSSFHNVGIGFKFYIDDSNLID